MITIFNRRELITTSSQQRFFRIREALSAAGIDSHTKTHGAPGAAERARFGPAGPRQDPRYPYAIYVHQDDYDRAARAIQPALRDKY